MDDALRLKKNKDYIYVVAAANQSVRAVMVSPTPTAGRILGCYEKGDFSVCPELTETHALPNGKFLFLELYHQSEEPDTKLFNQGKSMMMCSLVSIMVDPAALLSSIDKLRFDVENNIEPVMYLRSPYVHCRVWDHDAHYVPNTREPSPKSYSVLPHYERTVKINLEDTRHEATRHGLNHILAREDHDEERSFSMSLWIKSKL